MNPRLHVWWLLTGCSGAMPAPGAGGAVDRDGDGWTTRDGDCDDADPTVFPVALDAPLDEVDQDCDGADAQGLDARGLERGDLVVTEVMPDPLAVGAEFGEWFELRNQLDIPVDLRGLVVRDDGRDDFLVDLPVVVDAGAYAVLAVALDPDLNGGIEPDFKYEADYTLSNDEDAVVLEIDGREIDRVAWAPGWPLEDGIALSLDPAADAASNDVPEVWCLAVEVYGVAGYGSPGAENPTCPPPFTGKTAVDLEPGELVITEILQNPLAVDDALGEWIEVLNASGDHVDLYGLSLHDGDDSFDLPHVVVAPGERLVLGSFLDPEVNGGVPVDVEWRWSYGLANSGQSVVLAVGTREIDRVEYDNGLTFPDPEGASMSLDPGAETADDNDDGASWCAGSAPTGEGDLGSPGAPNPPCR